MSDVIRARVPRSRRKLFERLAKQREVNLSVVVREALLDYARRAEAADAQPSTVEAGS